MLYQPAIDLRRRLVPLILTVALFAAGVFDWTPNATAEIENAGHAASSAEAPPNPPNDPQNNSLTTQETQLKTDIGKFIRRYELVKLNRPEPTVRENRRLIFQKKSGLFEIELAPYDMRAPVYRAEEVGVDGKLHLVPPSPVHTYKGFVVGHEQSIARFTIDNTNVDGLVMLDGERYFVEPAQRYSSSASATDFVLYNGADINPAAEGSCGVTLSDKVNAQISRLESPRAIPVAASASNSRILEMATEADVEYVTALGGSAQANNEILGVMNQVDGIFSGELGVRITIVYQHTWATQDDPYTSMSTPTILSQFREYWNEKLTNVSRDLAHMFTARSLNDFLGYAYIGVVCNSPTTSYAVSYRRTWRLATLVAHEIGHNFGATHINTTYDCNNSIMESGAGYATVFCGFSRTQMNNHVTNLGSCLSATGSGCNYIPTPSTQSHTASPGTGVVNLSAEADCPWLATSTVNWIHLNGAGNPDSPSYLFGKGPASFGYSIQQNTSFLRKGIISVAGRSFTVTQAGALPDCPSTPIQVGQPVPGQLTSSDCLPMWRYFGYAKKYSFPGVAGQQIQITMNSTAYEPYLYLTAPDGSLVASSNSSLSATSVAIPAGNNLVALPASGMYTVEATSLRDQQVGSFTLSLTGPCGYSASPTVHSFTAAGGNASVNVTTNAGCPWQTVIESGNSWLSINGSNNGAGNGGVSFSVVPNFTNAARTGTLNVAGQTITVNQAAPVLQLITDDGSNRGIAIDAVLWVRDPFMVLGMHNFSSDRRSRVAVFATNLVLNAGEDKTAVTAQAVDAQQRNYQLPVEFVGKVPNLDWCTQVVLKLPDALTSLSEVEVFIRLHGVDSNRVVLKLKLP